MVLLCMQHLLNLFLCQSQATYARSFSLLPLQRHPGYTLKVAFCKLQHSYMVLATLVANQRRLKLGVGSCVASSFSDFRLLLYPNLALCCCNSSWTVSFIRFCSSISVFRLVSNRSHLLQVSLLVLPNDISNFVLNISWQNFPLLGILILICISPCTNHTLYGEIRWKISSVGIIFTTTMNWLSWEALNVSLHKLNILLRGFVFGLMSTPLICLWRSHTLHFW